MFEPRVGPVDVLSADAHQYTDGVPVQQQVARQDPRYNGMDAEQRYEEADGG